MSVSILADLTTRLKSTEEEVSKLYFESIKECAHGIAEAWLKPYLCTKCAYKYVNYCMTNSIQFEQIESYLSAQNQILEKQRKVSERLGKQEEKEKIERERAAIIQMEQNERSARRAEEHNALIKKYGSELAKYISERGLSSEELGKRYERYIGYKFESMKYKVVYHGIKHGKEDRGIDLIAEAKDHVAIVQCKRRGQSSQIHENTITQLIGTLATYKKEHQNIKKSIECFLYTQNDNLDDAAKKTLLLHSDEITHMVEPYPFDVGKSYPLIKCNVGDKDKIYHLPTDSQYDKIKIEIKKKEFFVETIEEAEKLGFRRTKS